jgi:hypothetical protein
VIEKKSIWSEYMTIYDIPGYKIKPGFCPNSYCSYHHLEKESSTSWYIRDGFHFSKARGSIPRFKCKECGKRFSTQTFSIHYWTHSTTDFRKLDAQMQSGAGQRQLGREYEVTTNVIANRQLRLARNYLASFDEILQTGKIYEDCCFDGFESYLRSKYHPIHLNILIGKRSQMPYGFTLGQIRRKGSMTALQKLNREKIDKVWRLKRGHYTEMLRVLFNDLQQHFPIHRGSWKLVSDMAQTYPSAIKRVPRLKKALNEGRMQHIQINSKDPRTFSNKLFASNYIDRELRKNQSQFVKSSVRQAREVHLCLCRAVTALGHHAFQKPFRIHNKVNSHGVNTHSEEAGFRMNPNGAISGLYLHRHVWSRLKQKMEWMRFIWQRVYENPPIIDFETGQIKKKWQPGSGYFARHLLA